MNDEALEAARAAGYDEGYAAAMVGRPADYDRGYADGAEATRDALVPEMEHEREMREECEQERAGLDRQCEDLQAIIDERADAASALLRRALAVLASVPAALLAEQGEAYLPEHIKEALK